MQTRVEEKGREGYTTGVADVRVRLFTYNLINGLVDIAFELDGFPRK